MQIAFGSGLFYATPLMDAYGNAISAPTPILLNRHCSLAGNPSVA